METSTMLLQTQEQIQQTIHNSMMLIGSALVGALLLVVLFKIITLIMIQKGW